MNVKIFEIALFIILVFFFVALAVIIRDKTMRKRRHAYKIIIAKDIGKFGDILKDQVKEVEDWIKKTENIPSTKERTEAEYGLGKIKETIEKMKRYLSEEIDKIK